MTDYFSDRENGARPRIAEVINEITWQGLGAIIEGRLDSGACGHRFPEPCPDGNAICGTNVSAFWRQVRVEIPDLSIPENWSASRWPSDSALPPTLAILDFLEFVARSVAEPIRVRLHDSYRHHHLTFNRENGLGALVEEVNRLLARAGIGFELAPEGYVRRLLPEPLGGLIRTTLFRTGDRETDELLDMAVALIVSPDARRRQDALEKLWDAFERTKTLEPGCDKKAQANALLARATAGSGPHFQAMVQAEAKALTDIGNQFRIRHSETDKEDVREAAGVDYLFFRMFVFTRYLLLSTGRTNGND